MKTLLSLLTKPLLILEFMGFYLFEVVASNLRLARDILSPSARMKPALIHINVENLTDRQLLAMANLVTMTPGTLSLDVVDDRSTLLVHSLYVEDSADAARQLEESYTRRIRRVF